MKAVLIGGMQRMKEHYREIFAESGIDVEIFSRWRGNLEYKLKNADLILVLTSMVSTNMAKKATEIADDMGIPIVRIHRHSLSSLRRCLAGLEKEPSMEKCRGCGDRYRCETYGYTILKESGKNQKT
jgi:hypothetical protein